MPGDGGPTQNGLMGSFSQTTGRLPLATSTTPYANRVEVSEGEHDATLSFYRDRDGGRSRVSEVTVPLSVLKALKA